MAGRMEDVAARSCWDELGQLSLAGRPLAGGALRPSRAEAESELARLMRAIEAEIVPRLVGSRRLARAAGTASGHGPPAPAQLEAFARLALERDAASVAAEVEALRARGTPLEAIFLHWLAPAARRLGELWVEDACDFTQVTIGLWRLQQVLYRFAAPPEETAANLRRRALVVPLPGEQHSFGAAMVAEFLRRAGWTVWSGPLGAGEDLVAMVRSEWFAIVGLSASGDVRLGAMPELIRAVRRASRNRSIGIMVGGHPFNARPELLAEMGADATASDARKAVARAEEWLATLDRESGRTTGATARASRREAR